MRPIIITLCLLIASVASAQDGSAGFTFAGQTGFEFIHYTETFTGLNGGNQEAYVYDGNASSLVGTFSIEYDLEKKFDAPFFAAVSFSAPIVSFQGREQLTVTKNDGFEYLTQTNDVEHRYTMARVFFGFTGKPVFQPFIMFERALFQSTRSSMMIGTDSGTLVPADNGIVWKERVWSSHCGGGFQGGIPLDEEQHLFVKYRLAGMFPLSSFVTNDHPAVRTQSQHLGQEASGLTVLARVALQYNWHPRSSLQLGVDIYTRSWDGNGKFIDTNNDLRPDILWPANTMDAIPVLLGVTWSI